MERGLLLFLIGLVLLTSFVSADITIADNFEDVYSLGDTIKPEAILQSDVDQYVILGSGLNCDGFELDFFKSARDLGAGETVSVALSDIPVNKKMVGACRVKVFIEDFEGDIIEEDTSDSFVVSDDLDFNISADKSSYLPGETVLVSGNLAEPGNYNMTIELAGRRVLNKSFSSREFIEKVELREDVKGGFDVEVKITDEHGNSGTEEVRVTVVSVPTTLEVSVLNESVAPGDLVLLESRLYDQANIVISGDVIGIITGPDNAKVDEFNVSSPGQHLFQTGRFSPAGKYTVDVTSHDLQNYVNFVVEAVRDIEVTVSDSKLFISNVGNVIYSSRGNLDASDGDTVFKIPLDFDLGLGESTQINLAEELPGNYYNLSIRGNNRSFVFENSFVEDSRDVSKRVSQRVSLITGNAIIDTSDEKNFFFVAFLGVILVGVLIFFTNNRFKAKLIGAYKEKVDVQGQQIGDLSKDLDSERQETARVKNLFGQYVDTSVLDEHDKVAKTGTEKREISVLFTDIRGFSAMFGNMDDTKITEMLNPYFKRSHEIINRHGGMVNKFIGDSVMALFNAPRKCDDHLLKAVKSALDIQKEMVKINADLEKQGASKMSIGIGVDSGSAAVGHLGGHGKVEYSAIGNPVNMSARLESKAEGGQVLITDKNYQKIKDKVVAEKVGKMQFKNIQGEFDVWNVTGLKREVHHRATSHAHRAVHRTSHKTDHKTTHRAVHKKEDKK